MLNQEEHKAELNAIYEATRYCNSYSRLPRLLEIATMADRDAWLVMLGQMWGFDNVSEYQDILLKYLRKRTPARQMMDPNELEVYENLGDEVTIYRGCYSSNRRGICWSLDRDAAARYPFMDRYVQPGTPLLVEGVVNKGKIIAVKLNYGEVEIITDPVHVKTVAPIKIQ